MREVLLRLRRGEDGRRVIVDLLLVRECDEEDSQKGNVCQHAKDHRPYVDRLIVAHKQRLESQRVIAEIHPVARLNELHSVRLPMAVELVKSPVAPRF